MNDKLYKMDDKPFEHICKNGVKVKAVYCDFTGGITVTYQHATTVQLMEAIAEAIGYHAVAIFPHLKNFNGYGNLHITLYQSPA